MAVRMDLVNKELESDINIGFNYENIKLTKEIVKELFQSYYTHEYCEFYYDSEPSIENYISDIAFMYEHCTEEDINSNEKHFTKKYILETYAKEYNVEEAKLASEFVKNEYANYMESERRLTHNNWIEVHGEGIWSMTQNQVDKYAKKCLIDFIDNKIDKSDRVYLAKKENDLRLYIYGRDELSLDYWFIFERKYQQYYKTTTNNGYLIGELFNLNEMIL